MNEDLSIEAEGEAINEETIDKYSFAGVKLGDGVITFYFSTKDPRKGTFWDPDFVVGTIAVFSNGYIDFFCDDERYTKDLYEVYKELYGDNPPEIRTDDVAMHIPKCESIDLERFTRAKNYIKDHDVQFYYHQDKEVESEIITGSAQADGIWVNEEPGVSCEDKPTHRL